MESLDVSVNFRLFTASIITVFIFFLINEALLVKCSFCSKLADCRFSSLFLASNDEFSDHESLDRGKTVAID